MAYGDERFPGGPLELPGEPERTGVSQRPPKFGFSARRIVLVLIIVALIGGGFAAWKFFGQKDDPAPSSQNTSQNTGSPSSEPAVDVPTSDSTKTFKADFPRIEFAYPGNWIATADQEQRDVRIESPEFAYTSVNGSLVTGNFRIYIRQGARTEDGKYIGRGVAALPSEKLTYSDPPPGQRPETNLTFFGLDTPDHFAFFLIAGNFSLEKGETLGPNYGQEAETYIITGGYSSEELTEDMATNPVPLDYFQQTDAYKQAIDILKSLKLL